jgi:hypothetical protein
MIVTSFKRTLATLVLGALVAGSTVGVARLPEAHAGGGGLNFVQVPGRLASIAAGADGAVWGLNAAGNVYHYDATTGLFDPVAGTLTALSVGDGATVWGLNKAGQIYQYNPNAGHFFQIPGRLLTIAASATGAVWGLNLAGSVYTFQQ